MSLRLDKGVEPIPGYMLIERLGRGGFGEVWKVEAPGGLPKAIKFVYGNLMDLDDISAKQELKALNRVKLVHHPFLLGLERVDIIDGNVVIVMELADRDLTHRFKESQGQGQPGIPRCELLGYMEEAAEALDIMNIQHNLQHLDVKPHNLFLVRNHIKVADFGLAKDLEGMTASLSAGITPIYASPETFEGRVTRFSDQYSLAIVFQEMLTGQRPFTGGNAHVLMMQHVKHPPDLTPLTPQDRQIVGKALAKNSEERFPTCMEFVQALRTAALPGKRSQGQVAAAAQSDFRAAPVRAKLRDSLAADLLRQRLRTSNQKLVPADEEPPSGSANRPRGKRDQVLDETPLSANPKTKRSAKRAPHDCPRCGAALTDPNKLPYCLKCGYNRAGVEGAEENPKDCSVRFTLTWQWVMVVGMIGIGILTMLADLSLPRASLVRALWCVGQLLVGLAGFVAAHVISMRLTVACSNGELTMVDVLGMPRTVWAVVVQQLPESRLPIMLTFWAASLALGSFLLGGLSYWFAP